MNRTGPTTIDARPRAGRIRPALFVATIWLFLAAVAIAGPALTLPVTAALPEDALETIFGEEALGSHRIHILGFSLALWLVVLGMASQLRNPERKQAQLWTAAVAVMVFLPLDLTAEIFPLTFVITALVVGAVALHPVRWPRPGPSWTAPALPVAVVGAVPAFVYGLNEARLQVTGLSSNPHVADVHHASMATLALGVAVAAVLGTSDMPGRRMTAWTAGVMSVVVAIYFIAHPDLTSSMGVTWGVGLALWAAVYLAVAGRARPTGGGVDAKADGRDLRHTAAEGRARESG